MNRTLLAGTAALALSGTFYAGTISSGTPGADSPGTSLPRIDIAPAAFTGDLRAASSCTDLLASYVERGVDQVGPWGWGGQAMFASDATGSAAGDVSQESSRASSPTTSRQTNGATGTNVQEAGVDEPDIVKSDGSTLYRVDGDDLTTYAIPQLGQPGAQPTRIGSLDLPRMTDAEILLVGDTVVALSQDVASGRPGSTGDLATTRVAIIDVSDPAAMTVEHTYDYDTSLVAARLHQDISGDTVRIVLQAGLPDLDFAQPGTRRWLFGTSDDDAMRINQDTVRATTIDDWLPQVSTDGGAPVPALGCDQVGLPDDEAALGTLAVIGFDPTTLSGPADRAGTGLAVDSDVVYASADRLYVATSAYVGRGWSDCITCGATAESIGPVDTDSTRLYSFALDGATTTYVGSAEVDGQVRDKWSLDEADQILRVAVAEGRANAVVLLEEDGDDMVEIGRVDGLGVGEDIQSVQWFDDLALLVTFRQTDPLFAVDLTTPTEPRLLGELKIPGFSSYLHPLGSDRLVGVGEGPGQDGGWGAQLGLFDVTDLTAPRRIDLVNYGFGSYALAGSDPRQFTWLPDQRTVLTVITDARGAGQVSVVRLDEGTMSNRLVDVSGNASAARLVPLADGRVVLATAGDASFLDLT